MSFIAKDKLPLYFAKAMEVNFVAFLLEVVCLF